MEISAMLILMACWKSVLHHLPCEKYAIPTCKSVESSPEAEHVSYNVEGQ
ncbi:hypothetical protein M758_3G197100 [Ceratodon purpureus]|uniref:Uncharacterized protein n=1 Tax=Ceratodon purpureus TaxID=3225 RepID=A0A8T0IKF2_CERPU|nr:hypothetical protein KC19_3G197800 [Ceratodon purpureus]KAG0623729.1 hypothetical protein M758_3G197100 [Ceratodon purpureus]